MAIDAAFHRIRRVAGAVRRSWSSGGRNAKFRGAFSSYEDAMAAVRPNALAGYDNEQIADVAFDAMCKRWTWDYPVIFWIQRLSKGAKRLLDAGGHMGAKYRAFADVLELPADFEWIVYDVPAIVRAGRERSARDGIRALSFYDTLEATPATDLLVASGLLQYLDIPFTDFLNRLPMKPRHIILNKVATSEGPTIFTLEDFGMAEVPYRVYNHAAFRQLISDAGYRIVDEWTIQFLSHTHTAFGQSTSRGFCLERER